MTNTTDVFENRRSFVAKYSRILRKKFATKVLIDLIVRATLARFGLTRRMFHLYLRLGSPADVPHRRLDDGKLVVASTPINALLEAHLRRYDRDRDLVGYLEPGRLTLAADIRVYELRDCELMPWLGIVLHRPSGLAIFGEIHALPSVVMRRRAVKGRVLSLLANPRGPNHYFHFLEDITLAMRALAHAGSAEPITVLVRENLASFQRVVIDALAKRRPHIRILPIAHYEVVQPERLIMVRREPCPIINWFAPVEEWCEIGDMVRDAYAPGPTGPHDRRIYLTRNRQRIRRLANEDELAPILERHGFETVAPETLSHRDQVHLMMQSGIIIAGEGSAITNLIFADKPLKLILMCPWEILNPTWEGLTAVLGHEFEYIEGGKAGWNDAFSVVPEKLAAVLNSLEKK